VRGAVRRRVGRLEPGVQELLQVAALVGLEFSLGVASDAAGLDETEGLTRVEQAVHAGLVEEIGIDRFRFTHTLVRDALQAELSASRRARMHAAIAASIEGRAGSRLDEQLHALAHHYAEAGTHEYLERAVDYAVRAGRRSTEMLAADAAVEDLALALSLLDQLRASSSARTELLTAKGDAEFLAGRHREALLTFTAAADLARQSEDWPSFTSAVLAYEEANWRPGLPGHTSAALIREALEHEDDAARRVRLQAGLSRALHFAGDPDARQIAETTLSEARRIGDRRIVAYALNASVQTLAGFREGEPELVLEQAREVRNLVSAENEYLLVYAAEQFAAVAALCVGDRDEFDVWYTRLLEMTMLRFYRYISLSDSQMVTFMDGRLDEAEQIANQCLEYGEELGEDVSGPHGVQMFLLRREQDRLGEVAPMVNMLLRANPLAAMWRPGLALLIGELGMHDEGEQLLRELTVDGAVALPRDGLYPGALCLLAEAAFLLGVSEPASLLEAELWPWRHGGVPLGHTVAFIGAANRYLALLAWLQNNLDDADARFAAALDFNRRLRSPVWTARTLADWAGLRRIRGDDAGADALAAEATALAERYGLAAVARLLAEQRLRKNMAE
jgi:tetratricopeptide (TPR) repeat protein